jgi:hypothetical protein
MNCNFYFLICIKDQKTTKYKKSENAFIKFTYAIILQHYTLFSQLGQYLIRRKPMWQTGGEDRKKRIWQGADETVKSVIRVTN